MSALVKLPDGTVRQVNNSQECSKLIQEIVAEHSSALRDGRRIDAPLWAKAHGAAFDLLPSFLIADLTKIQSEIQWERREAELRANWWLDLQGAIHGKEPVEVSPAQRAIIAGNHSKLSNWREAREAIDQSAQFDPPRSLPLNQAVGKAWQLVSAARHLDVAIDASIDALEDIKGIEGAWTRFESGAYQQYLKARGAFETAMEALYGDESDDNRTSI